MHHCFPRKLKIYATEEGKVPFIEWLESLDSGVRSRVKERLDRISLGNLGDWKAIRQGVSELRLKFGPGYRIYFARDGNEVILLLSGGHKTNQSRDITKAIEYWKNYLER